MARRSRSLLRVVVAAALFACDGYDGHDSSTLVLVVRVEPTVEEATAFPAQVLVGFDSGGSGFVVFRLGVLCAPPGAPFVVTGRFAQLPTDAPSAVDAWIVPVDSATPATCGALPVPQPVPAPAARPAGPRASGDVQVLAGCGTGDVRSAAIVLGG